MKLACGAALGVVLASAAAGAAEHKCPPPGTEVITTQIQGSGAPIRYEGQDGLWCLRSQGGKPISSELGHFRFFARDAKQTDFFEKFVGAASTLWPIAPGKQTSFLVSSASDGSSGGAYTGTSYFRIEIVVEGPAQVSVPAGNFTALPIVVTMRGEQGNYHHSRWTYYYAPELATNVKYDYRLVSGSVSTPGQPWELVSIRPPATQ